MNEKMKPGGPNITGEGYNPDVKPRSGAKERKKTGISNPHLAAALAAALGAGVIVGADERPREPGQSSVDARVPVAAPDSTEIRRDVLGEQNERYHILKDTLTQYASMFMSGESGNKIQMLDSRNSIKQVCRFTSDWMIAQDDNLDVLWKFLQSRRSEWAATIEPLLDKARALGGMFAPPTNDALRQKIADRIASKQPLKCGMGLLFVSTTTQLDAQKLGSDFIIEVLQRLIEDT